MGKIVLMMGRVEELAKAAEYDANKLASLCGVSIRQLQRYFAKEFNRSPQFWLNERRLCAAAELLLSGESVKKVAFDLGFKQPSHFCRQFKMRHQMTPSQFVRSYVFGRSGITDVAERQSIGVEMSESE